jgi:hypothetical protein
LGCGAESFEIFKFSLKGFDVIGDQRWKKTVCPVESKGGGCALHFLSGEVRILKVHPAKSINLDIE